MQNFILIDWIIRELIGSMIRKLFNFVQVLTMKMHEFLNKLVTASSLGIGYIYIYPTKGQSNISYGAQLFIISTNIFTSSAQLLTFVDLQWPLILYVIQNTFTLLLRVMKTMLLLKNCTPKSFCLSLIQSGHGWDGSRMGQITIKRPNIYKKQLIEETYIRFFYFITRDHLHSTIDLK